MVEFKKKAPDNVSLHGLVMHVGFNMIGIPISIKHNDLSDEELRLFFKCVQDIQAENKALKKRLAVLEKAVKGE